MELHRKLIDKTKRLLAGIDLRSESVWPGLRNDLFVAHASIYNFFSRFASKRRVLDAGCGVGYGADILFRAGAYSVLGVDLSPASIRFATRRYGSSRVAFRVGDLQELSLPPSSSDLVVSSNAIEHLAKPIAFLRSLSTWLSPGGVAVVAVPPIVNEFQLRQNEANPYHLSNLMVQEWHDLLGSLGWAVQCVRHGLREGVGELDFGSLIETEIEPTDFEFESCSLDVLCSQPTLSAIYVLSNWSMSKRI